MRRTVVEMPRGQENEARAQCAGTVVPVGLTSPGAAIAFRAGAHRRDSPAVLGPR